MLGVGDMGWEVGRVDLGKSKPVWQRDQVSSGDVWESRVLGQQETAYRGSLHHGCRVPGMWSGGPGGAFTGQGTRGVSLAVIRLSTGWAGGD
jgi:hypothetical protein